MPRRRDISLITALGISAALHAVLLTTWYGYARHGYVEVSRRQIARPQGELIVPVPPSIGESGGTGESLHAQEGADPMRAREAPQDQAFLRRQQGEWLTDDAAEVNEASSQTRGSRSESAVRVPQPVELPELAEAERTRFGLTSLMHVPQLSRSVPQSQPDSPARPTPPSIPRIAGGGPISASESDPFRAEYPEIRFIHGQVEVRFGRQVRTTRPRLSMPARLDLVQLGFPTVVMRVETDARGNVVAADIHRSSGSGEVDLACRIAMLDWWIEPPTDASGNPIPDVMYWRLIWR